MNRMNQTENDQSQEKYIAPLEVQVIPPTGMEALQDATFDELSAPIRTALANAGWSNLMPVQAKAMPYMRQGVDMMIQSKTGSGKTGAFLIPLFEIVELDYVQPQALILVPTRELCVQVEEEARRICHDPRFKVVSIYGGVKYEGQLKALKEGVHLVVATPGRLIDHLQQGNVKFDYLRDFIMDEADEMLSMGFYPDMKRIQRYLPKQYCTTMFSATIPETIKSLSREFQSRTRGFLSLSFDKISNDALEHTYMVCDIMDKDRTIVKILEHENPQSCIIFCNTKRDVEYMGQVLENVGFDIGILSGDVAQKQRQATLNAFRSQELRILIATDVAARGIDVSHVTHVILHDHPDDSEVYIHRSGRTARAGRAGKAISVVSSVEEISLKKTAQQFEIHFEKVAPYSDEELERRVQERTLDFMERALRDLRPQIKKQVSRFEPMVAQLQEEPEVLAMLIEEFYRKTLKLSLVK